MHLDLIVRDNIHNDGLFVRDELFVPVEQLRAIEIHLYGANLPGLITFWIFNMHLPAVAQIAPQHCIYITIGGHVKVAFERQKDATL
jgi:hypothetical protein